MVSSDVHKPGDTMDGQKRRVTGGKRDARRRRMLMNIYYIRRTTQCRQPARFGYGASQYRNTTIRHAQTSTSVGMKMPVTGLRGRMLLSTGADTSGTGSRCSYARGQAGPRRHRDSAVAPQTKAPGGHVDGPHGGGPQTPSYSSNCDARTLRRAHRAQPIEGKHDQYFRFGFLENA